MKRIKGEDSRGSGKEKAVERIRSEKIEAGRHRADYALGRQRGGREWCKKRNGILKLIERGMKG